MSIFLFPTSNRISGSDKIDLDNKTRLKKESHRDFVLGGALPRHAPAIIPAYMLARPPQ
jgi:hypothetical protein